VRRRSAFPYGWNSPIPDGPAVSLNGHPFVPEDVAGPTTGPDVDGNATRATPAPTGRWAWSVRSVRPPTSLVARTRWLFTVLAVASVLLSLPGLAGDREPVHRLLTLAAYAGLITLWSVRYRTGRTPFALDVVEPGLVLATSVFGPEPGSMFGFLFAALWLRAIHGSTGRIIAHCALMAAATLTGLAVWPTLPGNADPLSTREVMTVVGAVPVMFLTTFVARYLVLSLFAREQAQRRDEALVQLGNRLIGLTDRREILRCASACVHEMGSATPGLRMLVASTVDGRAVVIDHVGELARVPDALPPEAVPDDPGSGEQQLPADGPLAELTGERCAWLGVPMTGARGWIVIGGPTRTLHDSAVACRSMINQVGLALRNSAAHRDLSTQASRDALTGLANRAAFTAALDAAMAGPRRPIALLFLDLDDFKLVNDGLGHSAGDELLCRIADRLRAGVRAGDLCARLGGDEFAVLLGDDRDAAVVGQRLVEVVATPVRLRGRLARVGASVGLALTADAGTTGEQLVQRADVAMYAAKAKGKNRVQVFDPGLLVEDGRAQFEDELVAAAGAGQLVLHYQPIVLVQDGGCVAVEALVRWQHPTRGLLQPGDFIPVAEDTGAILDIGEAVLRRACADAVGWTGATGPLAVHVNVSAVQLTAPGFVEAVHDCLAGAGMAPRRLVLEITEGMVLDSPAVHDALGELARSGVTIAIDDFGTGYSALSTLRSLPLDVVKIDKSFLAGGPSRTADEAVVEAVVQMARRLGLQVVAEGVERVDQQQFLREVGAHAAQGNLHLRPIPAAELVRWLADHNAAHRSGGRDSATVTALDQHRSPRPAGERRLGTP
jgi:diguanylate cyclase (GGDEF)-like protein